MAELRKKQLRGLNFNTIECYSTETDCLSGETRKIQRVEMKKEEGRDAGVLRQRRGENI